MWLERAFNITVQHPQQTSQVPHGPDNVKGKNNTHWSAVLIPSLTSDPRKRRNCRKVV